MRRHVLKNFPIVCSRHVTRCAFTPSTWIFLTCVKFRIIIFCTTNNVLYIVPIFRLSESMFVNEFQVFHWHLFLVLFANWLCNEQQKFMILKCYPTTNFTFAWQSTILKISEGYLTPPTLPFFTVVFSSVKPWLINFDILRSSTITWNKHLTFATM